MGGYPNAPIRRNCPTRPVCSPPPAFPRGPSCGRCAGCEEAREVRPHSRLHVGRRRPVPLRRLPLLPDRGGLHQGRRRHLSRRLLQPLQEDAGQGRRAPPARQRLERRSRAHLRLQRVAGVLSVKKLAKSDPTVVYMSAADGPFRCGGCRFFQIGEACTKVAGDIYPDDCCNLYKKTLAKGVAPHRPVSASSVDRVRIYVYNVWPVCCLLRSSRSPTPQSSTCRPPTARSAAAAAASSRSGRPAPRSPATSIPTTAATSTRRRWPRASRPTGPSAPRASIACASTSTTCGRCAVC